MMIVCIESPFKPSEAEVAEYADCYSRAELLRQNIVYARLCVVNSLLRGESPIASHLLYTQVWSEKPELRQAGIRAGIEVHLRCDIVALYVDLGVSSGMQRASENAQLVIAQQARRCILDARGNVREARRQLADKPLDGFPYLEELLEAEGAEERGSVGRIRIGA